MGVLEGNSGSGVYVGADSSTYNSATVRIKGITQPAENYDAFGVYYQIGSGSWDGWSYVTLNNTNIGTYETSAITISGLPPSTKIYFVARVNFRGTWYYGGETTGTTPAAPNPTPSTPTLSLDGVSGKTIRVKVVTGNNTSQVKFDHYENMSFGRYNTLSIGSNTTYYYSFDVPNYGTNYFVDCQAISSGGDVSSWSNKVAFTSGSPTPQIRSAVLSNVNGKTAQYNVSVNEVTTEIEVDCDWLGGFVDFTESVTPNGSKTITVTAPEYGKEYKVDFRPRSSSVAGNWTGFISFKTKPLPVTNLRATSRNKTDITIVWSSSEGAVSYLCKAYDVITGSEVAFTQTTSTAATLGGLTSGKYYSLVVWAKGANGDLDSEYGTKVQAATLESIPPEVYVEAPRGNTNSITVVARAVDRLSGINRLEAYVSDKNSTSNWAKITKVPINKMETENLTFVFLNDASGFPFVKGQTYNFKVTAFDEDFNSATSSTFPFVVSQVRPNDFSWGVTWVTGQPFSLKASQWNKLTQTINDFRYYKDKTNVSFPVVNTGEILTAVMFNQARTAISEMGASGVPATVYKGDRVTPTLLNQIASALNSIP